jgi:hypothetical protein
MPVWKWTFHKIWKINGERNRKSYVNILGKFGLHTKNLTRGKRTERGKSVPSVSLAISLPYMAEIQITKHLTGYGVAGKPTKCQQWHHSALHGSYHMQWLWTLQQLTSYWLASGMYIAISITITSDTEWLAMMVKCRPTVDSLLLVIRHSLQIYVQI